MLQDPIKQPLLKRLAGQEELARMATQTFLDILSQELLNRHTVIPSIITTTSWKSTWDTVPYFGINGLSLILCLWSPLHPLSKLLAMLKTWKNNFEWKGGGRSVFTSHRPVTSSDLNHERLVFCESVSTFLQLVVANTCNNYCSTNDRLSLIEWA